MRAFLFLIMIIFISASAHAEYRVYELAITDTTSGRSRTVVTTLDNIQYTGYYHVKQTEAVTIQATWMCWQRSDYFRAPCPNPKAEGSKR